MNINRTPCRDLSTWLSWQEANHPKAWDLGLERIGRVWQALGGGRIGEHVVIVAGTNGKGSCVRWCEALAVAHGISVATFTSPHLYDYRERIRFDGEYVDAEALVAAFTAIDAARGDVTLTYFEWAALAAFYLFRAQMPQLVVLEVGLGGRLDATNLIDADAAIITRIGLDHVDWLGHDIEQIAREKAGVMRYGQTVALADAHPPKSLLQQADALKVRLWRQGEALQTWRDGACMSVDVPQFHAILPLPRFMAGVHQDGQLAACIAVLAQWFSLSVDHVADVVQHTAHLGRLMWYNHPYHQADWLFDVAHNQDSAEILHDFLQPLRTRYRRVWCVCGMLRDKAHQAVFATLHDVVDGWVLCTLDGTRGYSAEQLANDAVAIGVNPATLLLADDCLIGVDIVQKQAQIEDLIVVMGSFVTVANVLKRLENNE